MPKDDLEFDDTFTRELAKLDKCETVDESLAQTRKVLNHLDEHIVNVVTQLLDRFHA